MQPSSGRRARANVQETPLPSVEPTARPLSLPPTATLDPTLQVRHRVFAGVSSIRFRQCHGSCRITLDGCVQLLLTLCRKRARPRSFPPRSRQRFSPLRSHPRFFPPRAHPRFCPQRARPHRALPPARSRRCVVAARCTRHDSPSLGFECGTRRWRSCVTRWCANVHPRAASCISDAAR
jgi:hypothetical protein